MNAVAPTKCGVATNPRRRRREKSPTSPPGTKARLSMNLLSPSLPSNWIAGTPALAGRYPRRCGRLCRLKSAFPSGYRAQGALKVRGILSSAPSGGEGAWRAGEEVSRGSWPRCSNFVGGFLLMSSSAMRGRNSSLEVRIFPMVLGEPWPVSLAPGFSRVFEEENDPAVSTASRTLCGKPLKRFSGPNAEHTRLKPGANEMSIICGAKTCDTSRLG